MAEVTLFTPVEQHCSPTVDGYPGNTPVHRKSEGLRLAGRLGVATLMRVARDKKATASARVSAARTLVELAGLLADAKRPAGQVKDLQDMTPDELHAFIAAAEGALASKAKPVEQAGQQHDAKLQEMLE